eukprot:253120-Prymnesium_polylepis.2
MLDPTTSNPVPTCTVEAVSSKRAPPSPTTATRRTHTSVARHATSAGSMWDMAMTSPSTSAEYHW